MPYSPAFPTDSGHQGMSLRDYFAAKAMAAQIMSDQTADKDGSEVAKWAYWYADAMIAFRSGMAQNDLGTHLDQQRDSSGREAENRQIEK